MKTKQLVLDLINLEIYDYADDETKISKESGLTIKDSNGRDRLIDDHGLTDEDVKLILMAKQTRTVASIASMVKFFVVLTVISMFVGVIWALSAGINL